MGGRWLLALLLALALNAMREPAAAQLEVDGTLDGQRLDHGVTYWRDASGSATLAQVRQHLGEFRAPGRAGLSFGLPEPGAYWIRLPVRNRADAPRTWMLEVGYPHLDYVTLYLPGAAAVQTREAGDMLPFSARAYRNHLFLFEITEPARSERSVYLRVVTHGVLYAPLRAWDERRFLEHYYLEWTLLFGFYGVAAIMLAYNFLLFWLTRLREYGLFALVVAVEGFSEFVKYGHAIQFLVPDRVDLAQHLMPFCMNLAVFANCLFATDRIYAPLPIAVQRAAKVFAPITGLCALLTLVVPFGVTVLLTWFSFLVLMPCAALVALSWRLSRKAGDLRSVAWTNALTLGWLAVISGSALSWLSNSGALPPNNWTDWGFTLGAALQFVLVTAALASRVRWLQLDLANVNEALQRKVDELGSAIDLTQTETARAEAAANAKNQIIATMTHELRTPLNAIINIPEGLEERFQEGPGARCRACRAEFALEPQEPMDDACPNCGVAGALARTQVVEHVGNPAQSVRYLEIVEKAGRHLAQVIDGILGGGHDKRSLSAHRMDVVPLLEEVMEQMNAVAARADVRLRMDVAQPALWLSVDALRFRQIVINLVANAIKFSHAGGEVTVSARLDGTHAVFSVADHGIGIAAEKRGWVFETFEQAHDPSQRQYGGTGLGLSIVRSLVRLHGGDVWLESEVGRGTTFHFSMPVRRTAAA